MTLLDRANVQDELFRLASLGLQEPCRQLDMTVPTWMQALLTSGEDGEWDDYRYQVTLKALLRYGFVRRVAGLWKGTTMHGLVRWRAGAETDADDLWQWYLVFLGAVCDQVAYEFDNVHFRRYVAVHLPQNDKLLQSRDRCREDEGAVWMWRVIGDAWQKEGRLREAEKLRYAVYQHRVGVLGEEHPDTIIAIGKLASTYWSQERWQESEDLGVRVLEATTRVLGEEHLHALTAAANLASTYWKQGRWKESEELDVKVMEASARVLGEEHPDTLIAMASLAHTLKDAGQRDQACQLMGWSATLSSKVFGDGHSHTVERYQTLAEWDRERE